MDFLSSNMKYEKEDTKCVRAKTAGFTRGTVKYNKTDRASPVEKQNYYHGQYGYVDDHDC